MCRITQDHSSATPPPQHAWHLTVRQAAWRGMRWFIGWLPCIKGHHRIHPTIFEAPQSEFIDLDSKKRIRVLHLFPDPSSKIIFSQLKRNDADCVDSWDDPSLESSGGEHYWFMRWNRPLRPALHRGSCNCSFRRSQIRSIRESKQAPKLESKKEDKNVAPVVRRKLYEEQPSDLNKEELDARNLDCLAESMSHSILKEAILRAELSSEGNEPEPQSLHVISTSVEHLVHSSANHSEVDIEAISIGLKETAQRGVGIDNPVFHGSNDNLHCTTGTPSSNGCCDNVTILESKECQNPPDNLEQDTKELNQDHNANERDHKTLEEINCFNKSIDSKPILLPKEDITRRKHRKTCNIGSKPYLKKPILIMVHGAGSSCEVWRSLLTHMTQAGYECLAPDMLGHGLSSAPDVAKLYTFHSLLQDLLSIFDRFVTEGRSAVILGHGYGCSLAAAIARYRPEQVIQLVLISGGGPTPLAPRTPPSVSPCMRLCLEPLLMCGFKRDVVYSVCGKQMEPCSAETCAVPRRIVDHIAQGHQWAGGDAAFHRRIAAPTLLVHGMKDQHITLVQECEMERTIPRSFLEVIPEAGHWAMLETPDHLSHMVLCFIDWWAPPNRTQ